jgi:protein SCO1/2
MRTNLIHIYIFILISILAACKNNNKLPYYGPRQISANGDSIYHQIPPFSFFNQDGNVISDETVKGKIHVADFFFTSCPTICPKMTSQLKRLQAELKDVDIIILSFTVDPRRDSIARLKQYAEKNAINTTNWHLLTGNKEEIYDLGRNGYYLNAMEDDKAAGGFLHSEIFVLVDKELHIRGLYEGTSTESVNKLINDIKKLHHEYE